MTAILLPFVEAEKICICTAQDRIYAGNVIYSMIGTPTPSGPQVPGVWNTADLTPWGVPVTAKAAFLAGILIITHGSTEQVADLHLTFRRPSDMAADPNKYLGQTCEGNVGGGQRSNFSTWVALEDGKFDWSFGVANPTGWPTYASYGINIGVEAYAI